MPRSERKSTDAGSANERVHPSPFVGCHLHRWRRLWNLLEVQVKRGVQRKVLDYLELSHGWRTLEGLALDLNANKDSVAKALYRLRDRGLVRSRARDDGHAPDTANEWSIA